MKIVIDRQTWLRGEGYENSFLYRIGDGKMCCLGFACMAAGLSQETIEGWDTPFELRDLLAGTELNWLIEDFPVAACEGPSVSVECEDLMVLNDEQSTADAEKEAKIRAIFATHGIEVEFVN